VIYLDNAASAPLRGVARAAMEAAWEVAGNPSAVHGAGRAVRGLLEDARESLAADIGAHPGEIVFCSGGTEANNMALRGLGNGAVAVSAVEHPSVLNARDQMTEVRLLPVDARGRVIRTEAGGFGSVPRNVSSGGREETACTADSGEQGTPQGDLRDAPVASTVSKGLLLSVQTVNGETGVIQPLAEIAAAARSCGALVHSDAVQALGHIPLDFAGLGVDALTLSAHKVGGPVGIGALVVRRLVEFRPVGFGGEQEVKRRPGTVPVALAAGFAAAAHEAVAELPAESARLRSLHDRLIAYCLQALSGVVVNCSGECSPAIVNLTFSGLRADDLLLLLDREGIACSVGSACTAGVHRPSPVLLAMGLGEAAAGASLRFSFGWQTTMADVDALIAVLAPAVSRARSAS
jgi:cysteine desulfurase